MGQKGTHARIGTCSHIRSSNRRRKKRAVYPPKSFQHRISQFHMEPRYASIPDRTRNPPWESPRHRSRLFSPRDLLFDYFIPIFFPIIVLYSGPERVCGSPQAAAELWGGKHCGSVTSGHFHKLFFFSFFFFSF